MADAMGSTWSQLVNQLCPARAFGPVSKDPGSQHVLAQHQINCQMYSAMCTVDWESDQKHSPNSVPSAHCSPATKDISSALSIVWVIPASGAAATGCPSVALTTPQAAKLREGCLWLQHDPSRNRWWYPCLGGETKKIMPSSSNALSWCRQWTKHWSRGTSKWYKVQCGSSKLSSRQSTMLFLMCW